MNTERETPGPATLTDLVQAYMVPMIGKEDGLRIGRDLAERIYVWLATQVGVAL